MGGEKGLRGKKEGDLERSVPGGRARESGHKGTRLDNIWAFFFCSAWIGERRDFYVVSA